MDELLNSYGFPNEIGFVISSYMLKKFFDTKEDYNQFLDSLVKKNEKISENYGIPENLEFEIVGNFSIQSFNGKRKILVDKIYIMESIYMYFNVPKEYSGSLYLSRTINYEDSYEDDLNELKEFLNSKINDLCNVKTIDDLKKISTTLYNSYMNTYSNLKTENDYYLWNVWFKEEIDKDIKVFKRLKMWLKQYIDDVSNTATDDNLYKNINKDKFKLFLVWQYLALSIRLHEPNRSLAIYSASKMFDSIKDKNIKFKDIVYLYYNEKIEKEWLEADDITYDKVKEFLDSFFMEKDIEKTMKTLSKFEKINKDNMSYDEIYENILNLINKSLQKSSEIGAKDIDLDDLNENVKRKLKEELTPEKQNKLGSYIDRIEFYKYNTNPYKVQEGSGIFKNFHILYFTNGTVAIDKLNGEYGYLYIMPITTFYEILNNTEIKNLIEIRSLLTVKPISHRKVNWKESALEEIKSHSITKEEFEALESIKSVGLPINDKDLEEIKKKYANNKYILEKVKEKEEERKNKFDSIDKKLKEKDYSDYSEEDEDKEKSSLLDAEDEIKENFSNSNDLVSIFDYENKIKTKRNSKVSLDTKLRTMDDKGAIKCEMCGEYESLDTRNFDSHHIIPLSAGGIDNMYNTVCLCGSCHKKIHSNVPFSYEEKWKMLMTIRKNLEKTAPYYVEKFDRLFNPYYNHIYHNIDNLTEQEILELYEEEKKYYLSHKEEEDKKFLTEWNS